MLAILRNVCNAEFARRGVQIAEAMEEDHSAAEPMWSAPHASPEAALMQQHDGETIRHLIAALPPAFREAIVLRDINNLAYRDIADIVGVPMGTVMSRLARARSMLRAAWNAQEGAAA